MKHKIKLYSAKSHPSLELCDITVDEHGNEYVLMDGTITNCNFVNFQAITRAGLKFRLEEEPRNEDGIARLRVTVGEFRAYEEEPQRVIPPKMLSDILKDTL